jgi:hypothetical protein
MTEQTYTPHPFLGIPVAVLFPMLQQREGLTRYEARATITDLLEGRLGPVEITPPLPRGWRLVFSGRGVAIETADGILDAAQVFVKYATDDDPPAAGKEQQRTPPQKSPAAPADGPVKPEEPAAAKKAEPEPQSQKPAAATEQAAEQQSQEQDTAAETPAERDRRAIAKAAAELKPDDSVKRDDLWNALQPLPGISARHFESHIWPEARKQAGLTERGRPGPKEEEINSPR